MADNLTIPITTTATEAFDDVGGVLYPRNKVSFGVDGSAVDVSATNPLPVTNTPTGTQTVAGTVTANAGTGNFTVAQAIGTNLHTVIDSGAVTATISGTPNVSVTNTPNVTATISGTPNVAVTNTPNVVAATSGVYNTTPPTLTNGQAGYTQMDAGANTKVTEANLHAGEDLTNNVQITESRFSNVGPISASGIVKSGSGRFSGFIVTASSSGVIRFWANTSATGQKILDSFSVSAGQVINIPGGCTPFATGLYLEIVSGTCTLTPFFN